MTRISANEVLRGLDPRCVCFITSPFYMQPQPATDHLTWLERSHLARPGAGAQGGI